jgi:hypothetical protein
MKNALEIDLLHLHFFPKHLLFQMNYKGQNVFLLKLKTWRNLTSVFFSSKKSLFDRSGKFVIISICRWNPLLHVPRANYG